MAGEIKPAGWLAREEQWRNPPRVVSRIGDAIYLATDLRAHEEGVSLRRRLKPEKAGTFTEDMPHLARGINGKVDLGDVAGQPRSSEYAHTLVTTWLL